ncbi:MAG: hypothetical protein ACXWUM_02330 [Burkholderiaceae bacterium]
MRTTPSRFGSFVLSIDPDFEGQPTVAHASPAVASTSSVLEQRYPAAIRTLTLLWGYPELNQWFDKITAGVDSRLNFEPSALAELMLLSSIHQRICPHRPATTIDQVYATSQGSGPWRPARYRG